MVPLNQESYNNAINSKFCWRVLHPSNEWCRLLFTGGFLGAIHLNRKNYIIYTIVDIFVINHLIYWLCPLKQKLSSYTMLKTFALNVSDNIKIHMWTKQTKFYWFWFCFKNKLWKYLFKKHSYFIYISLIFSGKKCK